LSKYVSEPITLLNSDRHPHTAETPEPDHYSISPIETIRSMVSPKLTYMQSAEP